MMSLKILIMMLTLLKETSLIGLNPHNEELSWLEKKEKDLR